MTAVTWTIEFHNGTSYQDITADVLTDSVKWGHGISSQGPTDRTAGPGSLEIEMDNSASNSGAKLGYYSPDHANVRTGWVIGAKIRVKCVSGANTKYDLYRIKDVSPSMGKYRDRRVSVTAVDYMDEFEIRKITGLTVQTNKRGDELLTTLVATMPFAPTATSYGVGLYLMPYSFHDEQDEDTFCITVLQKITQSDMSYIYVDGDATGGETLEYETASTRYTATSAATFNDNMIELDLSHSRENIFNKVKVTTNPITLGTPGEVVAAASEVTPLEPSETKTVTLRYVDQSTTRRISAKDLITPVSGTDYIMSSVSGSLQGDLTANLTPTITSGANSLSAQLVNSSSTRKGFIYPLQVRGTKITTYNKVESVASDSTSITAYGERTINYNMPYQTNANVGLAVANELLRRHKDPHSQISGITYNANRSSTFMGYALTLGIGSRITITETATGVNTDFFINAVNFEITPGSVLNVTYTLERAYGTGTYFVLDSSALDSADKLLPL